MKTLDNFIIERLKLNKYTKIHHKFNEEYCIVVPFDDKLVGFCQNYENHSLWVLGDFNIYIIPINDIIEKTTKFSKSNLDRLILKIPDKYDNFEDLKNDYINKKLPISNGNLEKLKL